VEQPATVTIEPFGPERDRGENVEIHKDEEEEHEDLALEEEMGDEVEGRVETRVRAGGGVEQELELKRQDEKMSELKWKKLGSRGISRR
jgi:hypothetical protein